MSRRKRPTSSGAPMRRSSGPPPGSSSSSAVRPPLPVSVNTRKRFGTLRSGPAPERRSDMLKNWRAKQKDIDAIAAARQEDPFAVLGPHLTDRGWVIRAFVTDALSVRAVTRAGAPIAELGRREGDFFEALIPGAAERPTYRLEVTRADGVESYEDAYAFGP